MNEVTSPRYTDFLLPPSIVTKSDVARLVSEIEQLDEGVTAAEIRQKIAATTPASLPISPQLNDFLSVNKLAFDTPQNRSALIAQMRLLKDQAPVIHLTFAVPADRQSLSKLVEWLRGSIHAQALIEVGLQPGLVAGVYLRTPNHIHDLSMRAALKGRHSLLVKGLETLRANR